MSNRTYQISPFKIEEIDELYNNIKKFRSTKFTSQLFDFIKHYLDNNDEVPEGISFDAILKACGKIESMLLGTYRTPKEIISKKY
ncbi:MAG: hypothetical protein K6C05_00715 [Anaerovibrio sp.]|uniref:hypothetical protein n=1 Tax=Anaerovibrio sp. TaxID=1872532 RepID=UPI0025D08848|nr:hypothetical protein [Anaerovibrio sp.]MCR5175350.1 hypothetical protein [Anaerovibrio sp.]